MQNYFDLAFKANRLEYVDKPHMKAHWSTNVRKNRERLRALMPTVHGFRPYSEWTAEEKGVADA